MEEKNNKDKFMIGHGGMLCNKQDILKAANAVNNLGEEYGRVVQIVNGFRDDIKWGCAPHMVQPLKDSNFLLKVVAAGL